MITMMSCRTQKTIEIQKISDTVFVHKTDTIKKTETKYQTIYKYNKDSIETNKYTVDDTVYVEKTSWKTDIQYVYLERQDSTKEVKNDSTYQSKKDNQIIVKEQRKSMWENLKNNLKDIVIYLLFLFGCLLLLKTMKNND